MTYGDRSKMPHLQRIWDNPYPKLIQFPILKPYFKIKNLILSYLGLGFYKGISLVYFPVKIDPTYDREEGTLRLFFDEDRMNVMWMIVQELTSYMKNVNDVK